MKVGIITDSIDRESGSVGIFTENLVESLIDTINNDDLDNIEVVLIHSTKSKHPIYKKIKEIVVFPKLTIEEWKKLSLLKKFILYLKFYKKLHEICEKYNIDVLHFPQFAAASAPPLIFKKPKNVKLVVTLHGVEPLLFKLSQYPYARYMFVFKKLYAQFGGIKWKTKFKKIVDRIVTVSYSEKRNIVHALNIPAGKISVVYHGFNSNIFKPRNKKSLQEYLIKKYHLPMKPFVFHLSTHHPKKNVLRIIRAFKCANTRNHLLVVGGKGKVTQNLKISCKLDLKDKVIFTGFIHLADLPIFYNIAEIFIFPSLHESFGLPVIEAMACGTPVITSNIYATKEISGEAAYLVDPYNTEEIANAISVLLYNPKLRKKLSRRGLKRARRFSWKKAAKAYLKIYKEVYGGDGL